MSLPHLPTREAILRLLHSADEADRKQGIIELIRSHDLLSIELLEHIAAEDPSVEIRYFARRALSSISAATNAPPDAAPVTDSEETPSLLEQLQSADHRRRLRALRMIPRLPITDSLPALCRSLVKEGDPRWQSRLISALGRLRTPDAIEAILPYLQHRNARVRANAAEALGFIGTRDALKPLVPLLSDDDNRVKANVIQALQRVGSRELLELLRQLAQDSRIWMRDSAIYALSQLPAPEAREILEAIARSDPSERLRQKAQALLQPITKPQSSADSAGRETKKSEPIEADSRALSLSELVSTTHVPPAAPEVVPAPAPTPPLPPLTIALWDEPSAPLRALRLWQHLAADTEAPDPRVMQTGLRRERDELCLTLLISLIRRKPHAELFSDLVTHLDSSRTRVRAAAIEALPQVDRAGAMSYAYGLLEDVNHRVRANAVLALIDEPLFPASSHLRAMSDDPRETWRLGVLYVLSQRPRADLVPLLDRLLDDPSERVRDAALQVLKRFEAEKTAGIAALSEKIATRLEISRTPHNFFENSFDHLFSGLIRAVSSGNSAADAAREAMRVDADRARAQLLDLGRKALAENLLPPEYARNLGFLSDCQRAFLQAAEQLEALPPPATPAELLESVARASRIEWLRQKSSRFRERHDLLLVQGGAAIARGPDQISSQATTELTTQARRIETLGDHLPSAQTTVLPATDAPVSEIFDLTMRLYQKHVVALSLLSLAHFFAFMLCLFVGFVVLKNTGLSPSDLRDLKEVLQGPQAATVVGFVLWTALGAHCTFASFKAHLIVFLREYIQAGKAGYLSMIGEALTWVPAIAWLQGRKYLCLLGWLFLAGLAGSLCESLLAPDHSTTVFRRAMRDLSSMLVGFGIFGYGFLGYTMAEPLRIMQSESVDALTRSRKLTAPWIFKLFLLCAFSLLLVQFITSATQELLMLGTFISMSERFESLVRKGISLIAFLSQICLSPLLIANLVIFSLSLLHRERHQGRSGT